MSHRIIAQSITQFRCLYRSLVLDRSLLYAHALLASSVMRQPT